MTVDKKQGRLIGYARVSTVEQNLDMQIAALERAGVETRRIHVEKVSASARKRPTFEWVMDSLRPGDTLVVWRLDRLGRDVRQILSTMDAVKAAGAAVRSLTESIDLDTPIGAAILAVTAVFAQLERDNVRLRTRAGVEAARRRGVKFGQPPKLNAAQRAKCRVWKRQGLTVREIVDRVKSEYKITVSHGAVQNYLTKRK